MLIGVSRTGKTPLSMYLGYLGYKTANVPLCAASSRRRTVRIDASKIVGLTIDPDRLAKIRGRRLRAIGGAGVRDGYAELNRIFEELEEAAAVQRRSGARWSTSRTSRSRRPRTASIDLVDRA